MTVNLPPNSVIDRASDKAKAPLQVNKWQKKT